MSLYFYIGNYICGKCDEPIDPILLERALILLIFVILGFLIVLCCRCWPHFKTICLRKPFPINPIVNGKLRNNLSAKNLGGAKNVGQNVGGAKNVVGAKNVGGAKLGVAEDRRKSSTPRPTPKQSIITIEQQLNDDERKISHERNIGHERKISHEEKMCNHERRISHAGHASASRTNSGGRNQNGAQRSNGHSPTIYPAQSHQSPNGRQLDVCVMDERQIQERRQMFDTYPMDGRPVERRHTDGYSPNMYHQMIDEHAHMRSHRDVIRVNSYGRQHNPKIKFHSPQNHVSYQQAPIGVQHSLMKSADKNRPADQKRPADKNRSADQNRSAGKKKIDNALKIDSTTSFDALNVSKLYCNQRTNCNLTECNLSNYNLTNYPNDQNPRRYSSYV